MISNINKITLGEILTQFPFSSDFFGNYQIDIAKNSEKTISQILCAMSLEKIEDLAINRDTFEQDLNGYIEMMLSILNESDFVESVTIMPGTDKIGNPENYEEIKLNRSDIVSIVGATGSGKSRLLADIEWLANADTPTKRRILINGAPPDLSKRYKPQNKLVAQLSQNMNFVMDLSVIDFLEMHANSRMIENVDETVKKILACANNLAGEKFNADTNITSLSGGQSRALMIADTAILSKSPIVLIDEIENAGVDRYKALSLLVDAEKIVLIATHDPALALMANRRIVIKNGAIDKVIDTSPEEKIVLKRLDTYEKLINEYRDKLRIGETFK